MEDWGEAVQNQRLARHESEGVTALPTACVHVLGTIAIKEGIPHQRLIVSEEASTPVCTVLCIEDDPDLLLLIRLILGLGSAVRVLEASHGNKGLALARGELPSLILLDLHLPDLPGEEVLRQLKAEELTRQIPVIVISGDLDTQLSAHLLELGATQCLRKPFSVSDFLIVIEAAADTV